MSAFDTNKQAWDQRVDVHYQSEFYDELSQILHCKNTVSTMLKTISMMAFPPKAVDG